MTKTTTESFEGVDGTMRQTERYAGNLELAWDGSAFASNLFTWNNIRNNHLLSYVQPDTDSGNSTIRAENIYRKALEAWPSNEVPGCICEKEVPTVNLMIARCLSIILT
jgi:hypothetical protein